MTDGYICSYDVNVTPDKRKVFLHHEAEVLQTLQQVPDFFFDNPSYIDHLNIVVSLNTLCAKLTIRANSDTIEAHNIPDYMQQTPHLSF